MLGDARAREYLAFLNLKFTYSGMFSVDKKDSTAFPHSQQGAVGS
jgi:hypothetical protein